MALNEALYFASCNGKEEECRQLLDRGANSSWLNPGFLNETPLMEAAWRKHLGVAKLLISRGADVNRQNVYGNTAMILAAYHGNHELVELLLENGADPLLTSNSGKSALYWAKAYGKCQCAEILELHMTRYHDVLKEVMGLSTLPRVLGAIVSEFSATKYDAKATRRQIKRQPSTTLSSAASNILRIESGNNLFMLAQ
eukprot:gb/GEZN01012957.1/.p1 GENE.gb/GEZN01012957.1/~~gb/GEZN01012957.1/.p1  ORF type:complete len:198 (-),score=31.18 gb/GEZN01012957.1/:407-1000(-)